MPMAGSQQPAHSNPSSKARCEHLKFGTLRCERPLLPLCTGSLVGEALLKRLHVDSLALYLSPSLLQFRLGGLHDHSALELRPFACHCSACMMQVALCDWVFHSCIAITIGYVTSLPNSSLLEPIVGEWEVEGSSTACGILLDNTQGHSIFVESCLKPSGECAESSVLCLQLGLARCCTLLLGIEGDFHILLQPAPCMSCLLSHSLRRAAQMGGLVFRQQPALLEPAELNNSHANARTWVS